MKDAEAFCHRRPRAKAIRMTKESDNAGKSATPKISINNNNNNTEGKEAGKGEDCNYSIRPKFQMGDLTPSVQGDLSFFINPALGCLLNLYCNRLLPLLHYSSAVLPYSTAHYLLRSHSVQLRHGPGNIQPIFGRRRPPRAQSQRKGPSKASREAKGLHRASKPSPYTHSTLVH